MMQKSFKVRIYPNKEQELFIEKSLGSYRFVYNKHKEEKDSFYEENIKGRNLTKKETKELYKEFSCKTQKQFCEEFSWLKEISSTTIAGALQNCDQAYNNFYSSLSGKRAGKKVGFPKYKSKKESYQSFPIYMLSPACLDYNNKILNLPKLKKVKFRASFNSKYVSWFLEATPKHLTISKNPSKEYWCSILFEKEDDVETKIKINKTTGLDFSPKSLYINDLNEACRGYIPQKQAHQKQLTKLQRTLARKQKGSKNREKARIKLARLEKHIADSRRDFIEKETLRLVRTYDLIGIEDLSLKGISKFLPNAKNMVDTSWYIFAQKLQWKAQFNNCLVIKADRYYPSSKTCNHCGFVNKNLTLVDRIWICPNCGEKIIRDQNAALNLKENAIKLLLEDINRVLGWESTEVMSVEGIEVNLMNNQIYGVSVETERDVCEDISRNLFL